MTCEFSVRYVLHGARARLTENLRPPERTDRETPPQSNPTARNSPAEQTDRETDRETKYLRQVRIPHQKLIYFLSHASSFTDRPHYKRLPPVHIPCNEDILRTGTIASFCRSHIRPPVQFHAECIRHIRLCAQKSCRNQHQIRLHLFSLPSTGTIIILPVSGSFWEVRLTRTALQTLPLSSLRNSLTVVW